LSKGLPVSLVETQDLTGGGDHWQVIIVSAAFDGKGLLEQHRMVNEVLKEPLADQRIHALSLKTYSPAQWEKLGN
jgi:stress-induced morphogen